MELPLKKSPNDEHAKDSLICHGNVYCWGLEEEETEVLQTCFRLGRDRRNKKSIWHQNKTILVTAISLILNEAIVGYVCFAFIISRQNRWQRRHLKPHVRQNNPGCQCNFSRGTRNTFPSSSHWNVSQRNEARKRLHQVGDSPQKGIHCVLECVDYWLSAEEKGNSKWIAKSTKK